MRLRPMSGPNLPKPAPYPLLATLQLLLQLLVLTLQRLDTLFSVVDTLLRLVHHEFGLGGCREQGRGRKRNWCSLMKRGHVGTYLSKVTVSNSPSRGSRPGDGHGLIA
jgi:hypothetical protein